MSLLIWPVRVIDFPMDDSLIIVEKDLSRLMLYATYNKFPYTALAAIMKVRNQVYLQWGRFWCSLALRAQKSGLACYDEDITLIGPLPLWFLRGFVRQFFSTSR